MTLSKLLEGVAVTKIFQTLYGKMVVTHETEVNHVHYDSRKVGRGDLFVAIRGNGVDGNTFVTGAISQGAKVVVTDNNEALEDYYFMHNGVVKIVVADARIALARISANYFGHPAKKMKMVGVTGTNGKTTTAFLIKMLLESEFKTGLLGTIEYHIGDERIPATHTTPESLEMHQLFANMAQKGCSSVVMEVSSHALHQHRVQGIEYQVAVFTNLTQDHLDYHKTMDEYFEAKKILFDSLQPTSTAVINVDDSWGKKLFSTVPSKKISYGTSSDADIKATDIFLSFGGTQFTVEFDNRSLTLSAPLVGRFNVSNILAAFSTGYALGLSPEVMIERFKTVIPVAGRFEQLQSPKGWTAIVDYAHTPDALEKALNTIHDVLGERKQGKIITVFGCGGNRDTTKRPIMGTIASKLSDVVIVTSDNPRFEKPESIIDDIMAGVVKDAEVIRQTDRKTAVVKALESAEAHDVILIAGKGHEDYQIINDTKSQFSDKDIVLEFIKG